MRNITFKNTGLTIMACLLYTLFLTIAPLVGWSYYSLESSLIQCGVEWAERSWNVQSYNFTIFITNYFFPVGIILYCSIQLLKIVKFFFIKKMLKFLLIKLKNSKVSSMPNMAKDDEKMRQRIAQERQLTIMMLIYICNFFKVSISLFTCINIVSI